MSDESSSDDPSRDDLADAILAAKPSAPERVVADLARLNMEQLGVAGQERGGDPVVRNGLPWPPRVGRYQLLQGIGRGAMGEVWLGLDTELGRRVALKQLRPRSAHFRDRLRREAQALARLSHPNVVTVYGVEKDDHGQLFIAMELVEGQTLQQWQDQRPARGWAECVHVYIQAGRGLAAAHAQGLVHRDFKPGNCMIDGQGKVKVLDFGLVSRASTDDRSSTPGDLGEDPATRPVDLDDALSRSLTQTGTFVGTQAYMAPEALAGASIGKHGDQFSFCVSLYEAVYGQRPFAGDTRSALTEAVMNGRVRPTPKAFPVPSRLRRILLRGLEVDVKRRWPSMDALLTELGRLLAPRTKRWIVLGAASVGLMAGLVLGWQRYAEIMSSCARESAEIEEVWDDAREQEVRDAIVSTKLSYAGDTSLRVSSRLDEYSGEWESKYKDACEATYVRQDQGEYEWRLRRKCFLERKMTLKATVAVLIQADAQVAERATKLVLGLSPLDECDDVDQLDRLELPPPEDPKVEHRVDELNEQLATVKAEQGAGRYARALDLIEPIVVQAEEVGYVPLWAEALFRRGSARAVNGLHEQSEQDLERAYELAIRSDHEELAFRAANSLAFNLSLHHSRYDEARVWSNFALPYAWRDGDVYRLNWTLRTRAHVSFSKGDYVAAEAYDRQALKLLEDEGDTSSASLATTLNDLGRFLSEQGKHEEAERYHRRALLLIEDALGESHPDVAMSLNNLGVAVEGQGRLEEAERYFRRSLMIRERALGTDDLQVAVSAESLGAVLFQQGRYEESEQCYRRVLRIREQRTSGGHYIPESLYNLALVLRLQNHHDEAEGYLQRSLGILNRLLDEGHPRKLNPLVSLAEVALAREDFEAARRYAEQAVSIGESKMTSPIRLASAHYALARALWADPAERRRSFVLAEWARDACIHAGAGNKEQVAEVEEWLATHPLASISQ